MSQNNSLLIEVNHEDHAFVESVCSNGAFTFSSFFSHLLTLYKRSVNEPLMTQSSQEEKEELRHKTKKLKKE